jgi:hypothetical protein
MRILSCVSRGVVLLACALPLVACTTDEEPAPRWVPAIERSDIGYDVDVDFMPAPAPPPINRGAPPAPLPESTVIIAEPGRYCPYLPRHTPVGAPDNCCFLDEDCHDPVRGTIPMRCYGASCTHRGEGICKPMPVTMFQCWTTEDCQPNEICSGAVMSACGERPMIPDKMGQCIRRPGT